MLKRFMATFVVALCAAAAVAAVDVNKATQAELEAATPPGSRPQA
jgi:hypothetical protein